MKTISLLKDWLLREEPLSCGVEQAALVAGKTDGGLPVILRNGDFRTLQLEKAAKRTAKIYFCKAHCSVEDARKKGMPQKHVFANWDCGFGFGKHA